MEAISVASFLPKGEKRSYIGIAIRKIDTIKILLMILWETKSLDDKKYISLSEKIENISKMLGGWNGQLAKQNSPAVAREKWESCEAQRGVVGVPVVVEPVPVHHHLVTVLNEVRHVEVAIAVPNDYIKHHPYHYSLKPHCSLNSSRFWRSWSCLRWLRCFRYHNTLVPYTKYLHFLKFLHKSSVWNRNRRRSQLMDTGFGSRKPWSPTYSPTTEIRIS